MSVRLSRALSRLNRLVGGLFRSLPSVICDAAGFLGAGSIAYGSWLIYQPAGFLVAGALLMALSMLIGRKIDASKA